MPTLRPSKPQVIATSKHYGVPFAEHVTTIENGLYTFARLSYSLQAFIKWSSRHSLETATCFEERLSYLYVLNDLLHWGGHNAPAELANAVRSIALTAFRAAMYAPDVEGRRASVSDILARWKSQRYFEAIAFAGLEAGLLVAPKSGQYVYLRPLPLASTDIQVQLGRPGQLYWQLPVSTMLPHLKSYEDRIDNDITELTEIPIDACRPMTMTLRQVHLKAIDHIFTSHHEFPDLEEDEESQWQYEGWDQAYWDRRAAYT